MEKKIKRISKKRKWLLALALSAVVGAVSGCRTVSFYAQAIKGQYQIVAHEEKIEKLQSAPGTPAPLKAKFQLLDDLRAFAKDKLKLPVDGHYRKYVDVHRSFVVWNVEAAPEFSLEPKTWWYPLVGSLEYRGYFSQGAATNYARVLRKQGYDVFVGGVPAYSTLGWLKDPVLNTFLFEPEPELAETIFHELGHQRVFARGDTDFNEAFATTVGEEGARRWLDAKGDGVARDQYLASLQRNRQFAHLILETRLRLAAAFGDQQDQEGKITAGKREHAPPAEQLRRQKQQILEGMKQEYAKLKVSWDGNTEYDGWFTRPINNAQLNSVAAYYDLVPGFEKLLGQNGGDLEKFYAAVERLSKKPKKERQEWLRTLGKEGPVAGTERGGSRTADLR